MNGAVGELGWRNPYAYAAGNPVNRVDPSGMIDENPTRLSGTTCDPSKPMTCREKCWSQLSSSMMFAVSYDVCVERCLDESVVWPSESLARAIKNAAVSITMGFYSATNTPPFHTPDNANCSITNQQGCATQSQVDSLGILTEDGILTHAHYVSTEDAESTKGMMSLFDWVEFRGQNQTIHINSKSAVLQITPVKYGVLKMTIAGLPASRIGQPTNKLGFLSDMSEDDMVYFAYVPGPNHSPVWEDIQVGMARFVGPVPFRVYGQYQLRPVFGNPLRPGEGDSGGGYYNTQGELVGVLHSFSGDADNIYIDSVWNPNRNVRY